MVEMKVDINLVKKRIVKIFEKKSEVKIVAHGDWDGVVGAGLLKAWIKDNLKLNTIIIFPFKELSRMVLDNVITIETSNFAQNTTNSIIIDHHIQRKKIDPSNLTIIDNKTYDKSSVATLIADFFKIKFNREFLKAVDDIDNGKINLIKYIIENLSNNFSDVNKKIIEVLHSAPVVFKLYAAFRADVLGFPRLKIAEWISGKNYKALQEWASNKCINFKDIMLNIREILENNIIKIPGLDAILLSSSEMEIDSYKAQALKPAALYLQDIYKIAIIVYLNKKGEVFKGSIGTLDSILNFENAGVYKALEKVPEIKSAGGRAMIGGFQMKEGKSIPLEFLLKIFKDILKNLFSK
ncbi:MAG: hypothetical protein V3V33_11085 [Candidatus Lokiarchaeia archaeon]